METPKQPFESAVEMGYLMGEARGILEALAAHPDGRNMPPLPTAAQWVMLEEDTAVLDVVWAACSQLQTDRALLADYPGLADGLRRALSAQGTYMASSYVRELQGAEDRNMARPFSILRWLADG